MAIKMAFHYEDPLHLFIYYNVNVSVSCLFLEIFRPKLQKQYAVRHLGPWFNATTWVKNNYLFCPKLDFLRLFPFAVPFNNMSRIPLWPENLTPMNQNELGKMFQPKKDLWRINYQKLYIQGS
jgi:hypothetical protein